MVNEGHQPLVGDAVINDGPGLLLVVEKAAGANTVKVTKGVDARAGRARARAARRRDRRRRSSARPTSSTWRSTTSPWRCCSAACSWSRVLVAFLFEWRTALISLVAIPLSLMAAVLVLYLRGDTINTMILAGLVIAVGVVVDDAIIDVENIWRRLRERSGEQGRAARAADHPRGVARGPQRDLLRDAHQRRSPSCRCSSCRA